MQFYLNQRPFDGEDRSDWIKQFRAVILIKGKKQQTNQSNISAVY
jgi:hypothetical protein